MPATIAFASHLLLSVASMNLRSAILLASTSVLIPSIALSQAQGPSGLSAAPPARGPLTIQYQGGVADVYEGHRNSVVNAEQRRYFIAPRVGLSTRDGATPDIQLASYPGLSRVTFGVVFSYPDKREVSNALVARDPKVDPAHVGELRYANIHVSHPLFIPFSQVVPENAGSVVPTGGLQRISLDARPGVSPDTIEKFVANFKAGFDSPNLSVQSAEVDLQTNIGTIRWSDVVRTEAFSSFDQTVKPKEALLPGQVERLASRVLAELSTSTKTKFETHLWEEHESDIVQSLTQQLFGLFEQSWLDVRELQGRLASYEIDPNSSQFAPSTVTRFALDVKNTSTTEFRSKYHDEFHQAFKESRAKGIDSKGGTKFDLIKIFKGSLNGAHKYNSSSASENAIDKILDQEDYFRTELDRSFTFDAEGNLLMRVSVDATSNASGTIDADRTGTVQHTRVLWETRLVPITLSPDHLMRPKVADELDRLYPWRYR